MLETDAPQYARCRVLGGKRRAAHQRTHIPDRGTVTRTMVCDTIRISSFLFLLPLYQHPFPFPRLPCASLLARNVAAGGRTRLRVDLRAAPAPRLVGIAGRVPARAMVRRRPAGE